MWRLQDFSVSGIGPDGHTWPVAVLAGESWFEFLDRARNDGFHVQWWESRTVYIRRGNDRATYLRAPDRNASGERVIYS